MNRLRATVGEFVADVRNQKLRTTLTLLGITWGTVAVVVLLAFGVGLENQTRKRFHGLGDRVVGLTARPRWTNHSVEITAVWSETLSQPPFLRQWVTTGPTDGGPG